MKKSDNSRVSIIDINLFSERCTVPVHKLFYIVSLLCLLIVFTGCEFFNRPMLDFLEEWTNTAQIGKHSLDGSYPETGGMVNLPSGSDRVITYYVANPQNYDLGIEVTFDPNLLGWDPIRTSNHPDFSTTSNQGTVEQDPIDKSIIRLTLNENALASLDGTGSTLNPTISIVEPNSGRTFGSYTIPIRVNSAPNKAKNAVIMTWHDGTVYKYAVLFHLPQDLNNPNSPDRDVVSMTISGFNGQYNKTFAIPPSGNIDGVENIYTQNVFEPVGSGDSFVPFSGYRFVGIKTNFIVGDVVPSCTVTLRDSSGLESTTDVSTTSTKLTEIYVDPTTGNDSNTGSDLLPVATVGKAMEKLSGMTDTTIILVGNVDVQNTLAFTASYPNITLKGKGGATPVTLTYRGTGRAITVSGGKLTLGENITITGADDGAVELTGGEFVMETGSTLSGNGVFSGNISPVYIDGGAVCVRGGTFTMNGGTINSNEANSGGAVYVDGGSFTMRGGTISNNDAASGGGVSVKSGSFTMSGTDAKIQNNEAPSDLLGGRGGGVYVDGGTFTMTDGTISDNTAHRGEGGGIYVNEGNVSVSGGSIYNNIADTMGGGVYISFGNVEIADSVTIQYNVVLDTEFKGTELYIDEANLTISGGVIQSGWYSMGIPSYAIYSEKTFAMTGSPKITDCAIKLKQGAHIDVQGLRTDAALTSVQVNLPDDFYAENAVLLENAGSKDICDKFALDNPPSNGVWWIGLDDNKQNGILRYINGTLSGDTVTVTTPPTDNAGLQDLVNDSADGGYKVEITGGGTITVDSTVSVPGGADVAIKPDSGSVNINAPGDTTAFNVIGGELTLGGGGGVVNVSGDPSASSPTADGEEISLINISNGGTVTIEKNANIQNNQAGRGVTVDNGRLIMTGGSIKGNTGGYLYGSGVYVRGQDASFEMSGGEISGNTLELNNYSTRQGAGVMVCNGATFTLSDNGKITNNSGYEGAGVTVRDSAKFEMNGGEISSNTGSGTSGGVYLVSYATMNMIGGTIIGNKANMSSGAGGVYIGSSCTFNGSPDPSITASITGNIAGNSNVDVYFQTDGSGTYSPGNVTVGVGP